MLKDAVPRQTHKNPGPQSADPCGPQEEPPPRLNVPAAQVVQLVSVEASPDLVSWPAEQMTEVNARQLAVPGIDGARFESAISARSARAVAGVVSGPKDPHNST